MICKIRTQYCVSVFLCILLAACGGGSDTIFPVQADSDNPVPDLPPPPTAPPDVVGPTEPVADQPAPDIEPIPVADDASLEALATLAGTWQTGCIAAPAASPAPGRYILSESFEGGRSESSIARFLDEGCTQLFTESVMVQSWSKNASVLIPSGFQAQQLDATMLSIAVAYHDAQVVASLNASDYCGVVLKVGISVDLTECLLDLSDIGRERFDLFLVDNGVLYPGDAGTGAGNLPENRPTDVDFTQGHLRVQP